MDRYFVQRCKSIVQNYLENKDILINYLRDKQEKPYGVVVAIRKDNHVKIGVSVCNTKKDSFNKYVGIYIALKRAEKDLPISMCYDWMFRAVSKISKIKNRAEAYWKTEDALI